MACPSAKTWLMFTIEHEFDATVVTLIDEAAPHRQEDITITAFEDWRDHRTDGAGRRNDAEDHAVTGATG